MSNNLCSWSRLEDKQFEKALVLFPEETPNRWEKIASYVPGKSWREVRKRYEDLVHDVLEIDSGRVEVPSYYQDELWGESSLGRAAESKGKEREHTERRKGNPWTEEEHRLFLIGLQKYGKGDWRSISRNAVVSRTPTQVASHAQKYFLRLNSVKKDKKRSSIHDITTTDATQPMAQTNYESYEPNWNFELMDQSVDEPLSHPTKFFHDQGSPPAYQGFGFPV
ncbi:unnamed protein product [Dovyalis caffra]|uniref:Uncharacterized protein n=1 Tax=Dovyalis caffra TaxID=77055 RepID=A0AAV1RC33_9ROSI|nr:unnamed protein product [Dovyalis caffra]